MTLTIFKIFSWAMYEAVIYLLMNLILVEFRYLSAALQRILSILQVDEDGTLFKSKFCSNLASERYLDVGGRWKIKSIKVLKERGYVDYRC